jgi:hypothetical protein
MEKRPFEGEELDSNEGFMALQRAENGVRAYFNYGWGTRQLLSTRSPSGQ